MKALICCLLLYVGLYISQTSAHTLTGECGFAYADKDKKGLYHKVCHHENLPSAIDKKVSSLFIPVGFNMRIFKGKNRGGEWIDIPEGTHNLSPEWDNAISSVLYNNWKGCSTFYSGPNKTGKDFMVCESGSLVPGWNDQVASLYVPPRHFFRLFKELDEKGDYYDVRGSWTLKDNFRNKIKSMKLQHWNDCAFLYLEADKRGRGFMICDSAEYMPEGYDNAIKSIMVPKKMTVTLYKNEKYQGESLVFKEGDHNLPANFAKTPSSIKIFIEGAMANKD